LSKLPTRARARREPSGVHDKRVRVIRLTANGVRLRRRLVACLAQNPSIESLSAARKEQLLEILREVS
jgi:hypothetical protein